MDKKYDQIAIAELKRRLKRMPTPSEIINSDNDSDLVNETMWQLLKELDARISALEAIKR